MGHQCWHFHDSLHPGFDAETTRTNGDPVRQVYAALDAAVGTILASLDPDTTVVLVTLNGMRPSWGAGILLPEILVRLGVMHPSGAESGTAQERAAGLPGALRAAYRRLPRGIREPLYDLRQRLKRRWLGRGENLPFDASRSQCFAVEIGRTDSGIRLNLQGREPRGVLAPGDEAERFTEQLGRDLLELTNPDTGQRLVGLVEGTNSFCRSGDHARGGMFIAQGLGITPGQLDRVVSNLDLAPTFARMMGCEMPGVDGRPIPELLGGAVA